MLNEYTFDISKYRRLSYLKYAQSWYLLLGKNDRTSDICRLCIRIRIRICRVKGRPQKDNRGVVCGLKKDRHG